MGGVREAGEEGVGSGIPKVAGSVRKRENYATLCNISQSKKCKGAGAKKYRAGTGIKGYGKREVQTPLSPPPPILQLILQSHTQNPQVSWSAGSCQETLQLLQFLQNTMITTEHRDVKEENFVVSNTMSLTLDLH